jgi:hypothetical protein
MNTVKVIAPKGQDDAGKVHTIPKVDLQGFLDNGWTVEGGSVAYADMSVTQLKAELKARSIEADGKKEDLIAALEAADETK